MAWSIEKTELVGEIYDRHTAVHFSDYDSLSELESAWPDGHYVWQTHERLEPLVNAFERLWLIPRMLRINNLPLQGRDDAFVSRAEWVRITLEVMLVRLASIRDLSALLVAAVYELGLAPPRVNVTRLLGRTEVNANAELCSSLQRIAAAAPDERAERNRFIHEGIRRALGPHQLFDTVSHMEALGVAVNVEPLSGQDGETLAFDLATEHCRIVCEIERDFTATANELHAATEGLLEALHPEWLSRFQLKITRRPRGAASRFGTR